MACTGCSPKGFDAEFRDAEAKMGLGETDAALAILNRVARRYPDEARRPGVLLRIADIYWIVLDDAPGAVKAYGKVIDDYPLSDASMLARERRADILEKEGDLNGAIEDYYALLKHFPDNADRYRYRVLLAGAYLAQRNFQQARYELKPLLDDAKTPPGVREQALFAAAESFFLEGKPEKAMNFYEALLKEHPKSELAGEAKLHMATCVEEMGYLGAARDITKDARREYPNKKVIDTRLKSIDERGNKPVADVPASAKKPGEGTAKIPKDK